jgi:hypothetical protein
MGQEELLKGQKVRSRDVPRLLELLACDDAAAQAETLTLLCPCRNVRYDKEVWTAIFLAAKCSDAPQVKDRAGHAIGTLKERARTDPRSQELVRWLINEGIAPAEMEEVIPQWKPLLFGTVNGIPIPRYVKPSRTAKNRARR